MGGATARDREALMTFLKTSGLKPPLAVTAAPGKETAAAGFVTADFEEGTLFLASSTGRHYPLEWARSKLPAARRALPPGEYTLTGYRIARRDTNGAEWFLSATGPAIRRIVVRAGEEQQVKVGDTIHLSGGAHPEVGRVEIELRLAGVKDCGLTVYRDGKRIDVAYRLMSPQKKVLARGTLKYG